MIKTAVIGYGLSAQTFHLPYLAGLPQFELVGISSSQREQIEAAWPGVPVFASAETLIADSGAELVVITAPNAVHFSLAKLALEQDKHVLLEKPFVNTREEGLVLQALAAQRGRRLAVYHNRRWDGDYLTLQQLIRSGAVGQVSYLESHFDRFRPEVRARWREQPGPGAGTWYDLGSHLLDQVIQLFGLPRALTGRCLAQRPGASVTDYFHVQLHYADKEVVLHSSSHSAGPNLRFQLQGSQGSYVKWGLDPQEAQLRAGLDPLEPAFGTEPASAHGTLYRAETAEVIATEPGAYVQFYRQLADAIHGTGPLPVTAEQALQGLRLLELAERSSALGQTLAVEFA